MKTKIISLAFLLAFAFSTSALADDGETGQGTRVVQTPPPATVVQSNDSSDDLLTQILNAINSVIP